jgi:hypothetical protein
MDIMLSIGLPEQFTGADAKGRAAQFSRQGTISWRILEKDDE